MNTTDNIKSLFNSANPMTTENSYEPSGVCIGDTVLDNTPQRLRPVSSHWRPLYLPCFRPSRSWWTMPSPPSKRTAAGEVILRLTDGGDYVDISVCDSGTGISDLGAALTISGRGGAQTPLNEHGRGLKNALSYLSEEAELWLLESRTTRGRAGGPILPRVRALCRHRPKDARKSSSGAGAILFETGTTVRVRCGKEKLECLKPATKRAKGGLPSAVRLPQGGARLHLRNSCGGACHHRHHLPRAERA